MHCTQGELPQNDFDLEKICLDDREITLIFGDGKKATSRFEEDFMAKEAIKGAQKDRTYERFNAPLNPDLKARGISDIRIEENSAENLFLLIIEADDEENSLTIRLFPEID